MAAPATSWADWASTDRDASSPMDVAFFETWAKRDRDLRSRVISGPSLGGVHTFSASGTWESADFGSIRLWVPKWAKRLRVRYSVAINGSDGLNAIRKTVSVRPVLGALRGTESITVLDCETQSSGGFLVCIGDKEGADGRPLVDEGVFFRKYSDLVLSDSERGVELDFSYELMRGGNTTIHNGEVRNDPASSAYPYDRAILFYDEGTEAD